MTQPHEERPDGAQLKRTGIPMGVGIALGVAIGAAAGNVAIGIAVGVLVGGIGVAFNRRRGMKNG